jgi:hypothetical protein
MVCLSVVNQPSSILQLAGSLFQSGLSLQKLTDYTFKLDDNALQTPT